MEDDKIIEIIKRHVHKDVEIKKESELFGDLGLSSLDMVSTILEIEDKAGVNLSIMDLLGVKTVADLLRVIGGKK